ncbi:hypothetical protein C8A00DRAFT_36485 [Chaetomidium leptoderma]|uniref:Uncharacterized protein n=1 Tax=Chaetomidium leptoderma TaxID=669021 RepID=A0AAN6ZUT9_9PEZI|nr:hypothetical protein C8A00DRAFT_36485 [Chaetomidium leptoderma]
MSASVSIEPPDFVLPPGPTIIVVRVDRDAFQHLDPSMDPLADTDSPSRVLRKGKAALEQARVELSVKLFGADYPCIASKTSWPRPGVSVAANSALFHTKYVGFYFKQNVIAGQLPPAVFDLTSEGNPVDNCIRFNAVEVDEDHKDGVLENVRFVEDAIIAMEAEKAQATQ